MKYRGGYSIKDLRRDLEGGLGWAHSTESVANYLELILPTVREAKIRGSFRHTSHEDKTDPKKVVTTSFYKSRGGKLATCHAHGDGTWSIAFTRLGEAELKELEGTTSNSGDLDVEVRIEIKADGLYHYGEMKNKPQACRGYISLNNDEVHRMHHTSDEMQIESSAPTVPLKEKTAVQSTNVTPNTQSADGRNATRWSHYQQNRNHLDPEQHQLASDLAKEGLTKKEERALFQRLKTMPWEEQERILNESKAARLRDKS